jgi:superfamily II DNA or RNA helicase
MNNTKKKVHFANTTKKSRPVLISEPTFVEPTITKKKFTEKPTLISEQPLQTTPIEPTITKKKFTEKPTLISDDEPTRDEPIQLFSEQPLQPFPISEQPFTNPILTEPTSIEPFSEPIISKKKFTEKPTLIPEPLISKKKFTEKPKLIPEPLPTPMATPMEPLISKKKFTEKPTLIPEPLPTPMEPRISKKKFTKRPVLIPESKKKTIKKREEVVLTQNRFPLQTTENIIQNKIIDKQGEEDVPEPDIPVELQFYADQCKSSGNKYSNSCNSFLHEKEMFERKDPDTEDFLYPSLNDPNFNIKISEKKEFDDTQYNGKLHERSSDPKENKKNFVEYTEELIHADFELAPHQNFVRNYLSFQTPYNSLLLYHGLGSGKTLTSIGIAEEMRSYLKRMNIRKKIIVVASPNVQDNFKHQLFDERKLSEDLPFQMKDLIGNNILNEVNPTGSIKQKEILLKKVEKLIRNDYSFFGYLQFANYINSFDSIDQDGNLNISKTVRKIQHEFNSSLIIIDEIQNMKNIKDSKNNKIASKAFQKLVKSTNNLRLLFLTATPMFNSSKEIIWILNMMNMNDGRSIIKTSDVFDENDNLLEDGKEILVQKATGYISFVRGENPYTFPFRIYPNIFSPEHTFEHIPKPTIQMNLKPIPEDENYHYISLYLTEIGTYQQKVYNYILSLFKKDTFFKNKINFMGANTFNYTILQPLIQCLNITYPTKEQIQDNSSGEGEDDQPVQDEDQSVQDEDQPVQDEDQPVQEEYEDIQEENEEEDQQKENQEENIPVQEENEVLVGGEGSDDEMEINEEEEDSSVDVVNIEFKSLYGIKGIKKIMIYNDNMREKGKYKYRYPEPEFQIFKPDQIGNYSSKIKNICDCIYSNGILSEGIILIYSQYIDSGLIPMALALEEIGFKRCCGLPSLFESNSVKTIGTYSMITGDKRLSPNNNNEVKKLVEDENTDGERIKIVLISQAGSEGIDFKNIRQVHIMEPWYNMNRIEQIFGRAVRNFSHKNLPLDMRNVQLFMHGTILPDKNEESADIYIYRIAEYKARQIGVVSRILKKTAVDCILNHSQTNFTRENMDTTLNITLSTNPEQFIPFQVGDVPYSSTCDYLEDCNYTCSPNKENLEINSSTYSEEFVFSNIEKIINKIKFLFKSNFFYKKTELIEEINHPKKYSLTKINAALTHLIETSTEYLKDKYKRNGRLINIGEYYLFQPLELNNEHISIFERIQPIQDKYEKIQFKINNENDKNVPYVHVREEKIPHEEHEDERPNGWEEDERPNGWEEDERPNGWEEAKGMDKEDRIRHNEMMSEQMAPEQMTPEQMVPEQMAPEQMAPNPRPEPPVMSRLNIPKVFQNMKKQYDLAIKFFESPNLKQEEKFQDSDEDWKFRYSTAWIVMKNLSMYNILTNSSTTVTFDLLKQILVDHIIDFIEIKERKNLLNYMYNTTERDDFFQLCMNSIEERILVVGDIIGYILYNNDPEITTSEPLYYFLTKSENGVLQWVDAKKSVKDKIIQQADVIKDEILEKGFNSIIGFVERKDTSMVFKTKVTVFTPEIKRVQTGRICDEAVKKVQTELLNEIVNENIYQVFAPKVTQQRKYYQQIEVLPDKVNIKYVNKYEICFLSEFILRYYQKINKDDKMWFMNFETQRFVNFRSWKPTPI